MKENKRYKRLKTAKWISIRKLVPGLLLTVRSAGESTLNFTTLDINECDEMVCPTHSTCENTLGSYSCQCSPGYEWKHSACLGKLRLVSPVNVKPRTDKQFSLTSFICSSVQF